MDDESRNQMPMRLRLRNGEEEITGVARIRRVMRALICEKWRIRIT